MINLGQTERAKKREKKNFMLGLKARMKKPDEVGSQRASGYWLSGCFFVCVRRGGGGVDVSLLPSALELTRKLSTSFSSHMCFNFFSIDPL